MLRRIAIHSVRSLALGALAVTILVLTSDLCGLGVEASPQRQSGQTRTTEWFYWLDTSGRTIQRARVGDPTLVETVVTTSEISTPTDFVVDGDYVYWADDGNNAIRRKHVSGISSLETLVDSGISIPKQVAVDGDNVYWSDDGNNTIKQVAKDGSGNVETLAAASDCVNVPKALAVADGNLYWADDGSNAIYGIALSGNNDVTTIVSTGIVTPIDMEVATISTVDGGATSDVEYVYWIDNGNNTVKRVRTASPRTVNTIATAASGTMVAMALDPKAEFVYWLRSVSSTDVLERRGARAANGSPTTVTNAAGSTPRDLVLSADGNTVYWLDDGTNRLKRIASDGMGSVDDLVTTGLNAPMRLRRASHTETIAADCISDLGTLPARISESTWQSQIDATCPRSLLTFHVESPNELYIRTTSGVFNPLPVVLRGGIDGTVAATTTTANGASEPYIHRTMAGDYAIEMTQGVTTSPESGQFMGILNSQPVFDTCDVNLGTVGLDPIKVFGGYEAECGKNRNYFFHLDFQASISVTLFEDNFSPIIEMRPSSAPDSSTAVARDTGVNPNFFAQTTAGSHKVRVYGIDADSTYILIVQGFGLPQPTRTPIPTPTPRFQPGVDVRLDPDPRGLNYRRGDVHRFRIEGGDASFPALVRVNNDRSFAMTAGTDSPLDCRAGASVGNIAQLGVVFLHVCGEGAGTIEVLQESNYALLAAYSIFVRGSAASGPETVPGPGSLAQPEEDRIGLGMLIQTACDGANIGCNVGLIRNGVGALGSGALLVGPSVVSRGRASNFSIGIGVALFIVGLVLAHYLVGMPIWFGAIPIVAVVFLAGVMGYMKFRRLGA